MFSDGRLKIQPLQKQGSWEDLPAENVPGRVNKWSAEGMLARFYLTRPGVEANGSTRICVTTGGS